MTTSKKEMSDLERYQAARIEALERKLTQANEMLAELAKVLEVHNFEIL